MIRLTTEDLLVPHQLEYGAEYWLDHVLYDTPTTVAAAIRNASPEFERFTIAEQVAIGLKRSYAEVTTAAHERGAELYVALTVSESTFRRISLEIWLQERKWRVPDD